MEELNSHLDVTTIFWEIDDFCKNFEHLWQQTPQLPSFTGARMRLSEVMTIFAQFGQL